jgi:hypothetical protein
LALSREECQRGSKKFEGSKFLIFRHFHLDELPFEKVCSRFRLISAAKNIGRKAGARARPNVLLSFPLKAR